jgi:hypothetical protein
MARVEDLGGAEAFKRDATHNRAKPCPDLAHLCRKLDLKGGCKRKSAAALARLESCYETNSKALETNPFVKPSP